MTAKSRGRATPGQNPAEAVADGEVDLLLYSTSACHLCEVAEQLLMPWVAGGLCVAVEDISDSDVLFQRYGMSIPVLKRCDNGAELAWPFAAADIARLLAEPAD